MALCNNTMTALVVTKKSRSWRDRPQSVVNVLGETLSAHFANAIGVKNAKRGWRSKPYMFFGKNRVGTRSIGYRTRADLIAGWDGGMCNAWAKERKQYRPDTFARSRADAPTFGASDQSFEKLRWRGSWQRRRTSGWSAAAICTWWTIQRHDWICSNRDRDCFPDWYIAHQP